MRKKKFLTANVDKLLITFVVFLYFCAVITPHDMKKVVRTVWIGALSGLAFLAACTAKNGLTRSERKQLIKQRDEIQTLLNMREGSAIYGSPEVMMNYGLETMRMRNKLDSINFRLGENVDIEQSTEKLRKREKEVENFMKTKELRMRLESLMATIREREGSCVYGSPEIIEEYGRETRRMRQEAEEIRKQIEDIENE